MRLGAGDTHTHTHTLRAGLAVCLYGATSCLTIFFIANSFLSFFRNVLVSFFILRSLSNFLHWFCCKMVAHTRTHKLSDLMIAFEFVESMCVCVCVCGGFRISVEEICSNCSNFVLFTFAFSFFSFSAEICQFFDTMMHNVI